MWPHEVEPRVYSWYRDSLETLLIGESARRRGEEVKEVETEERRGRGEGGQKVYKTYLFHCTGSREC